MGRRAPWSHRTPRCGRLAWSPSRPSRTLASATSCRAMRACDACVWACAHCQLSLSLNLSLSCTAWFLQTLLDREKHVGQPRGRAWGRRMHHRRWQQLRRRQRGRARRVQPHALGRHQEQRPVQQRPSRQVGHRACMRGRVYVYEVTKDRGGWWRCVCLRVCVCVGGRVRAWGTRTGPVGRGTAGRRRGWR
jgi:hypothetical protein